MKFAVAALGNDLVSVRDEDSRMRYVPTLAVVLSLTMSVGIATGQPGGGRPGGGDPQRGGSRLPEAGSLLPEVVALDEDGNDFSLKELRGHYSVLVFGCLT